MNVDKPERLGALSGFAAPILGAIGGALERGWPSGNDSVGVASFIAEHRTAVLAQSMLFLLSSVFYLWFIGGLRSFLARADGGTGALTSVAFGPGVIWVAVGMVAQAFQIGQTMAAPTGVQPSLMWTMAATFAVANLPCAVMLGAVAAVSFRHVALPRWHGAISATAALGQLLLWSGAVVTSGALAPNGWLTYTLYPLFVFWLMPTAVLMLRYPRTVGARA